MNTLSVRNGAGLDSPAFAPHPAWPQALLAILVGLLLSFPRTRVVLGAPIYLTDVLAALLVAQWLGRRARTALPSNSISRWIGIYLFFVIVSEIRGMIEYGTPAESGYMMLRWLLAASMAWTVPRFAGTQSGMERLLKGLVAGTIVSSTIVIGFSLGMTRDVVIELVFRSDLINPGWEMVVQAAQIYGAGESAMRGRSPIGAATMTAGFLAVAWPLAFTAMRYFRAAWAWRYGAMAASLLAPIAMLMTYGRTAWLMVGVILVFALFFNLAGARRVLLLALCGCAILVTQLNFDGSLFFVKRVTQETRETLESPLDDRSTRERLMSYVEPFGHLVENPSWLMAGSGRTGNKAVTRGIIEQQLFDEGMLATHSGFAIAYYCFGLPAALSQVMLILLGFRYARSRLRWVRPWSVRLAHLWEGLLMSWIGMSLWWLAGHAVVGEVRGAMLQFVLCGLLIAADRLSRDRVQRMRDHHGRAEP